MSKFIYILTALLFFFLCTPLFTEAHVKWFTEVTPKKETIEHILSATFMMVSVGVALVLALLTQFLPYFEKIKAVHVIDAFLDRYRISSRSILKYGTALALLIQVLSGTIFAPEFAIENQLVRISIWVTIFLLIIPNHYATKIGASILFGLFFTNLLSPAYSICLTMDFI